jgi:hypothetical protein
MPTHDLIEGERTMAAKSAPVELRCDDVIVEPAALQPPNAVPCVAQLTDHWPHLGPKSPRT